MATATLASHLHGEAQDYFQGLSSPAPPEISAAPAVKVEHRGERPGNAGPTQ